METRVEVLACGKRVDNVRLHAGAERAALHTGLIFVVEALVRSLGVEIDGACAGGSRRRALIGEVQRAAGEIADDGSVAVNRQIAAKRQGKRGDGARKRRRGRVVRQNHVGDLLGGDGRAGDFDFVFSRSGVEEIVAETVGGGGIGERLRERDV